MDVRAFLLFNIHSTLIMFIVWHVKNTTASKETIFSKQTACKLETLVSAQCAGQHEARFRSLIKCAADCANEAGCLGISLHDGNCFYHYKCSQNVTCGTSDVTFEVYVKRVEVVPETTRHDDNVQETTTSLPIPSCQHDGVWDQDNNTCRCNSGWVGQFCERYGNSCKELAQHGYPQGWPEGLIWATIQLTANAAPVTVLCELRDTYFNTYILRNDGWTDLRDTLPAEYIDGFNISKECFWMGLKNIKAFNDAGYTTVKLDTGLSVDSNYNLFQMTYENFIIKDASKDFKFTFDNIVRKNDGLNSSIYTYGDCLTPLKGAKFVFPNTDEDDSAEECAMTAGVGWWYDKDCRIKCNPLGYKKLKNPNHPSAEHIIMDGLNCENVDDCNVNMYFVMF